MKMKKYLSIAILLMLMATPLVFTSCGGDDLVEGIENQEPTAEIWIEPYHIKGASVEDVKIYMDSRMNHFTMSEQVSAGCVKLVYSDKRTGAGIVYSFSLDRALTLSLTQNLFQKWTQSFVHCSRAMSLFQNNPEFICFRQRTNQRQ